MMILSIKFNNFGSIQLCNDLFGSKCHIQSSVCPPPQPSQLANRQPAQAVLSLAQPSPSLFQTFVELLLSMMMAEDLKQTAVPKFHNSGFCKFCEHCKKRHFTSVCQVLNCDQHCQASHPRLFKLENYCRFFKKGICAYKHNSTVSDEKMENIEKEVNCLRN